MMQGECGKICACEVMRMRPEIAEYIEKHILPRYEAFSDGHGREHVEMVMRESLHLARKHGADEEMAYVVAAYHDIGMSEGRKLHHMASGAFLAADERLCRWFSDEQVRIMREAVEDHRASAGEAPRSLYGCIIADADHFVIPENVVRRTILYGKANYPQMTEEEQIQRAREHMRNKYVEGGYLQFHLNDARSIEGLARLRALAADDEAFADMCRRFM